MKRIVGFILIALLGIGTLQCGDSTYPTPPDPEPQPVPYDFTAADKDLAGSSNSFGFDLFQRVVKTAGSDKNVFISPLSVSYALGMTRNGAAGDTWQAMVDVLRQSGMTDEEINQSYLSLTTGLTQIDPTVQFDIANSIWYQLGYIVQADFIDVSQTYFDAPVRGLNFSAPDAADIMNGWINDATNGKIPEMLQSPLDPVVIMYLINAIYFKGSWTHKFDPDDTYDGTFYLEDGTTEPCRMMKQDDTVLYLENELIRAVDIPYGFGAYSMTILMPSYQSNLDAVIDGLTEENWATWMASFHKLETTLRMPRFRFAYEDSLKNPLTAMGMGIAFTPGSADFTRLFVGQEPWIGKVLHKAFVQVDEEGTEAAAVTVVTVELTAEPGLHINQPFLFVIHEKETGTIAFMGRVANPVWED